MAVVVNMRNKKYYIHRIVLPNNAVFEFDIKKDTNQEMRKGVPKRSLADATGFVSNNSIPQSAEKSTVSAKNLTNGKPCLTNMHLR